MFYGWNQVSFSFSFSAPVSSSSLARSSSSKLIENSVGLCASDFDKGNEIYFRLGIIYKQQHKYSNSLDVSRSSRFSRSRRVPRIVTR